MSGEPSRAATAEARKLAAILFTDMVGFSRRMGADEVRTLRLLEVHNQIIGQAVAEHHGTVIKTVGDAFLVDFPSVVHAVQCARQIQHQFRTHNAEKVFRALGQVYYLAGRTEEAIAALKKSLNGSPADLGAHLLLAAVYSELGRDAEARAEAAAVLRVYPRFSIEA